MCCTSASSARARCTCCCWSEQYGFARPASRCAPQVLQDFVEKFYTSAIAAAHNGCRPLYLFGCRRWAWYMLQIRHANITVEWILLDVSVCRVDLGVIWYGMYRS